MRGSRFLLAASLVVAALVSNPSVAHAGDTVLAERTFSDGLAAMKAEKWEAACVAFAESNEADPSPGTQINLGVCNEKQKKYATALTWFDAAARLAEEQGRQDRVKFARSEHARVAAKVHKVAVTTAQDVADGTISVNGTKSSAKLFVGRETPLDPGKYTIELSAKGKKPVSKEITIPETAGTSALAFPALEDAPPEPAAPPGAPGAGDGATGAAPLATSDGSGQRTVGIVVAGVGVLALLAAGGVQLLAQSEDEESDRLEAQSKTRATQAQAEEDLRAAKTRHDAAQNNQLIAIITGAGGIVLVGVGAFLYFTAPHGSKAAGKPRLLPSVAPGYAGASFGFQF
jgi:hypothetical protein